MRILVVEDEPRLLHNLAKALREEGYAVDAATTGDEGLYKAEAYDYDAILLDVMLPGLDGSQAVLSGSGAGSAPRCSCSPPATPRTTASGGSTRGRMSYLVKPFDLFELLARLRALIRRAAGVPVGVSASKSATW